MIQLGKQENSSYEFFTEKIEEFNGTKIKLDQTKDSFSEIFAKIFKSISNINILIPGEFKKYFLEIYLN